MAWTHTGDAMIYGTPVAFYPHQTQSCIHGMHNDMWQTNMSRFIYVISPGDYCNVFIEIIFSVIDRCNVTCIIIDCKLTRILGFVSLKFKSFCKYLFA